MTKYHNTRAQKAKELLLRVQQGPSYDTTFLFTRTGIELSDEQKTSLRHDLENSWRIWSQTWLEPLVVELVPELKE